MNRIVHQFGLCPGNIRYPCWALTGQTDNVMHVVYDASSGGRFHWITECGIRVYNLERACHDTGTCRECMEAVA